MSNLATQAQGLAAIISSSKEAIQRYQALRDACSGEQWEQLYEIGGLGDLLSSLGDLEYDLERE